MIASRRSFMGMASGAALLAAAEMPGWASASAAELKSMTTGAQPISLPERLARIARVQALMKAQGIGALLVEAGSSLVYFTGLNWHRSERLTAAVIPVEGDILVVTPFFEEPSIRETLAVPATVRVWQEDESPVALMAGWLTEQRLAGGTIAIEETVRFLASDGLRTALPGATLVSGNSLVRGCRMIKTPAELALLQLANDVQVAAFRHIYPQVAAGMSQDDLGALLLATSRALGGSSDGSLVLIGESSAYPHGSAMPQRVRAGEVILFDAGVTVEGYTADISRTMVFGTPSTKQRQVFGHVQRGQAMTMKTAQIGVEAGQVDDAVRALYRSLGYGPGYKLPGTPHRTGHGIGLDGHEPVNLVHGETTKLAVGMCFSNEPGIYLPGEFGIRLEDCFHMTASGPRYFSGPILSIDAPFG